MKRLMVTWMSVGALVYLVSSVHVAADAHASPTEHDESAATAVALVADGRAIWPVVVGASASEVVRTAAGDLASMLQRITGVEFDVVEGDGRTGLAVGTPTDFVDLEFAETFQSGPLRRDDYLLRSHSQGIHLIGSTDAATQHAVWDMLYRLGYRYFFPSPVWEIVPSIEEPVVAVDVLERPDYYARGVGGTLRLRLAPWLQEPTRQWRIRNRAASSFDLNTGHAWQFIIRRHQAAFDENPEYLALVNGERGGGRGDKLCVSNEGLQQLVVADAIARMDADADSISMDPSDGGDHCECESCAEIGSISDQVVFLANRVAAAINEQDFKEDKYVGIYAYNWHSPPPAIDVHPNVIVSLESTHLRFGTTLEEMLAGWGARTELLGKREAYARSFTSSSGFLPGRSRASNWPYIQRTLPEWRAHGVRFLVGGGNAHWGVNGVGYYLAARILWDVSEADRVDEVIEDFIQLAFKDVAEPMKGYFAAINRATEDALVPGMSLPTDRRIGKMYRALAAARPLTQDESVRARIDDLVLYTRLVDLYQHARESQEKFDALVTHLWRMRKHNMADTANMLIYLNRSIVDRQDDIAWADGHRRAHPGAHHRDQEDVPFSDGEITAMLENGTAAYSVPDVDVPAIDFGSVLVPAGFESDAPRGAPSFYSTKGHRGDLQLVLWTENHELPTLYFSGGHSWPDRGPLQWRLLDAQGALVEVGEIPATAPRRQSVQRETWRSAETTHPLQLAVPEPGVYQFELSNTNQGYFWDYDPREGAGLVLRADPAYPLTRQWLDRHYFYVPQGIEVIGVAGRLRPGRSAWRTPDGAALPDERIQVENGFTLLTVPPGSDGQVWSFTTRTDRPAIRLLNVPGLLAFHPAELVMPLGLKGERTVIPE